MSSAAAPPAATAAPTEPPLSLTTVKARYPNLFEAYSNLSSRQTETDDMIGDDIAPSPIDAATGLATTIMFVDFTEPLPEPTGAPFKIDSDVNKFHP